MKPRLLAVFILVLSFQYSFSQKLTLSDLTTICSKSKWEEVNRVLVSKGWEFYDSEKGDSYVYNTITWSYNKDSYSDKAQAWFYLFTYEGFPNKISYTIFNQESYKLIENGLSSNGFKLIDSEIKNNEIVSTYGNSKFTLELTTEKRDRSDSFNTSSLTAYTVELILKAGVYDPYNGKKTDYYIKNVKEAEYTLKDGEFHGELKVYYQSGGLKKVGYYKNGVEDGIFKEYSEDGIIQFEYQMKNGELNGQIKTFYDNGNIQKQGASLYGKPNGDFTEFNEDGTISSTYTFVNGNLNGMFKKYKNGKISESHTFKNDVKEGEYLGYLYDEDDGELFLKIKGNYHNDEYNGLFQIIAIEDNNERTIEKITYSNGIKDGPFQEVRGDSLIIGNYRDDKLTGEYKIYHDFGKAVFGGIINTDLTSLTLVAEGSYLDNEKYGYWKNYDIFGTLISEGRFAKGKETGAWKYYYPKYFNYANPFVSQPYLIENYTNGKLEGKSIRYSYLDEEKIPCSELNESSSPLDTCSKYVYNKILETSFYKEGKLHGSYELRDSINQIVRKGNYQNGVEIGEWIERKDENLFLSDVPFFVYEKGNYKNGLRTGEWIKYKTEGKIRETFYYTLGLLHGEYIVWNDQGKPKKKMQLNFENLTELISYDDRGIDIQEMYEIYDRKDDGYKCRKTEYFEEGSESQEYWLEDEGGTSHYGFELLFMLKVDEFFSDGTQGYKDGEYKLFNTNEQPLVTGKYFKKDKVGLWTFYYYDQNVRIERNFVEDQPIDERYFTLNGNPFSGKFIFCDDDNGIKETRKIKNGLRNGKTVFIDTKTNKTIKREKYKMLMEH